jgi:hypothetical protein
MDEAEWLAGTSAFNMLNYLASQPLHRKLLLFGCACCRRSAPLWSEPGNSEIVRRIEAFAEGEGSAQSVRRSLYARAPFSNWRRLLIASAKALEDNAWGAAVRLSSSVTESVACELLREVIGNPFDQATINPEWLAWNGGQIVTLAQTIYDEERWQDMPVLADAVEEAGCTDERILAHCRQSDEHVRGCWLVDLLLGKE